MYVNKLLATVQHHFPQKFPCQRQFVCRFRKTLLQCGACLLKSTSIKNEIDIAPIIDLIKNKFQLLFFYCITFSNISMRCIILVQRMVDNSIRFLSNFRIHNRKLSSLSTITSKQVLLKFSLRSKSAYIMPATYSRVWNKRSPWKICQKE